MKRGIIYNNGYSIIIPNDEIWMTSWEIADLFYVTPASINHAIKRILKKEILTASQVHRYICLENGNHADVYNMEMVIALSFHFDTGHSILFRKWLMQKASSSCRTRIHFLPYPNTDTHPLTRKRRILLLMQESYKARFGQAIPGFFMLFTSKIITYYVHTI